MGMFDYLLCEYQIDAPDTVTEWQTKDCQDAPYLEYFKITDTGELWHECKEYKVVQTDSSLLGFFIEPTLTEWRPCSDFNGEVVFYGHERENNKDNYDAWWEYSAFFRDGKLVDLKRLAPVKEAA